MAELCKRIGPQKTARNEPPQAGEGHLNVIKFSNIRFFFYLVIRLETIFSPAEATNSTPSAVVSVVQYLYMPFINYKSSDCQYEPDI
ncbi:MAG: hypothetical protein A3K90_07690 [Pelodictyon luteolum]|uniref:Uncharacterized protein n=1 Tax=Pelodictyon luteolum TaxID=1100 RepID=A0A165LIL0_PELLU|nr:MAG: hypothetical protein A3K90_07690 [Pelodictyon luteolum]